MIHIEMEELEKLFDNVESKFDNLSEHIESLIMNSIRQQQQPFDCQQVEQTPARSNVLSFDHDYFHIDNGDDNTLEFVDQSTISSSKETRDLCINPKDSVITISYDNPNDEIDDDHLYIYTEKKVVACEYSRFCAVEKSRQNREYSQTAYD